MSLRRIDQVPGAAGGIGGGINGGIGGIGGGPGGNPGGLSSQFVPPSRALIDSQWSGRRLWQRTLGGREDEGR